MTSSLTVSFDTSLSQPIADLGELAELIGRTLPDQGLDRMTEHRVEEVLAVPALTAHL